MIVADRTKNTLLSKVTGGKYQSSSDLPTIPEMAHSAIDNLLKEEEPKSLLRADYLNRLSKEHGSISGSKEYLESEVQSPGLGGLLENVALSPLGSTKSIVKLLKAWFKSPVKGWKNMMTDEVPSISGFADKRYKTFVDMSVVPTKGGRYVDYSLIYSTGSMDEYSEFLFRYNPTEKLIDNIILNAHGGIKSKQLTKRLIDDLFESLPNQFTVNPHPMNEHSLPLFLRYAEKNKDKIRVGKTIKKEREYFTGFQSQSKRDNLINRYKQYGIRMPSMSSYRRLRRLSDQLMIRPSDAKMKEISQSVEVPPLFFKKIKQ